MTFDKCFLCKKPAEMMYCIQPEKERPLCGVCFGRWSPKELNHLLGVKEEVRKDA